MIYWQLNTFSRVSNFNYAIRKCNSKELNKGTFVAKNLFVKWKLKRTIENSFYSLIRNNSTNNGKNNNINNSINDSTNNSTNNTKNEDIINQDIENQDCNIEEIEEIEESHNSSWTKSFRNVLQTSTNINKIWNEYKLLVKNGNLKGTDKKFINRLLHSIKKFDKNRFSRLEKILIIYNDMKKENMTIGQTVRNYLIETYLENNYISKARIIFNEIRNMEGPLGVPFSTCPYHGRNDLSDVIEIFSLMHQKQIEPNGETKIILTDIFKFHIDHAIAIQWFNELMEKKLVNSEIVKEIVLELLRRNKFNEAIKIYEKMRSLDMIPIPYIYNSLIHNLGKQENIDKALELAKEMESLKIPFDTVTYNVLIKTYGLAENHEKTKELFEEMISKNETKPNIRTFKVILSTYAKLGKVNSALRALQKMSTLGLKPESTIYTALIELFAKVNDTKSMERVFSNMIMDKINPLDITYNILIFGYCRENDIYKAFQICRILITSGIEPDVRIYNALISLLAERKDPISSLILFNEMRTYGIKPDVYTFTNLIHAYTKGDDIRKAEEIFMDMEITGIKPKTFTYNVLLNAYVEKLDMKRAQNLYNEMLESLILPDLYTFCCLIDGFCKIGQLSIATSIFKHMQNNYKLDPDAHIYTVLIHHYLQQGDFKTAKTLYETMIKNRIKPTYVTYAVLIHGHARYGDLEFARRLITELINQSKSLNENLGERNEIPPTIFTPLMDAYAKLGQIDSARAIFDEMTTLGISHNAYAYVILMDAYRRIHNYEAVWQLWKSLLSVVIDALTEIERYDLIQEEWEKLKQEGFEFDSHNLNHYAQSFILSGKIKEACSIIDKNLMEGWYQQLEIWKHFDRKQSIISIKEQKRLLSLIDKFPHQKTLLMLADAMEKMKNQDWLKMHDITKTPASIVLVNEVEEEFPEEYMSFVQPWYLRFHAGHLRTNRSEAKFISRFYSSGFDNIKSNNPWKECNIHLLQKNKIPIIRRKSGGGTVFQDLDNSNYTLITPRQNFTRRYAAELVANTLKKRFNINAYVNKRYDIEIEGPYHHGTMLIDTDLNQIKDYLKVKKDNLISKGVKSVPSPVVNLRKYSSTVNHYSFCNAVWEEFKESYNDPIDNPINNPICEERRDEIHPIYVDENMIAEIPKIAKYREELESWNWTLGQTPEFTNEFEKNFSWAFFESKNGIITKVSLTASNVSNIEYKNLVTLLENSLKGNKYELSQAIFDNIITSSNNEHHKIIEDLGEWIIESL
ncbi:4232_t:CDS:10 [Diversispora eburnea]|uniref:4232_t:CDS:1 n=1 Tax=Diversispora eburnea TaxID=1213867 RepID=A0A9N9B1U6_9GLOM|nr:4232_t:CDS:10 [Diversispora eburnea]